MNKWIICLLSLVITFTTFGQKKPEDFGYKLIEYTFKDAVVPVIIKRKAGDEEVKKPILLLCQGSLPQPVIKYVDTGLYRVFPFIEETFLNDYHLIIIGKPGVPIIADVKDLADNFKWMPNGKVPDDYAVNNYLDYYVERNNYILKKLLKEEWVNTEKVVVAGHSEGSYVAAKMASTNKKITHVIYSGGNPYGRILSMLAQDRFTGNDSTTLEYWKQVVNNKDDIVSRGGDSDKTTYSFSLPADYLEKLKIPVLVTYGTKDWSAPYNDLFQVNIIRDKKKNFTFIAYNGVEHNFFPVNDKLNLDYTVDNWKNVGVDWYNWLKK
jgi:dienelactone hydrolase